MAKIKNEITESGGISGAAKDLFVNIAESALTSVSPFTDVGKYFTGLRAIIKVNDTLFGFAFGVSLKITTSVEEIWTIDSPSPYELAPNKTMATGTISMLHLPGRGPGVNNIQPNMLSFLSNRYISIEISDQHTTETIFKTNKAMIVGRYQEIQPGELSTIKLEWRAIEWEDENPPSTPNNADKLEAEAESETD